MEVLVVLLIVIGLVVVTCTAAASSGRVCTPSERRHAALVRQRQAAAEKMRISYRNLQIALLHLEEALDFRRAASYAKQARIVPAALRQRQFGRFRRHMLIVLVRRLRANVSSSEAAAGLQELVSALGVADLETDYLLRDAQRQVVPQNYADQIRLLHFDHQRRLAALHSIPDLDSDIREQLVEREHERLRGSLLGREETINDQIVELD